MKAPTPPRQAQRLKALRAYDILDTPREQEFDEIVRMTALICEAPVSVVNFIDESRQWFKAEVGLGVRETPLDTSICSHVILENDFVEINDTLDDCRMMDNPLCTMDGGFRYYAGALLQTPEGLPLGTLCVLDYRPRRLGEVQKEMIILLAKQVMKQLDLKRALQVQELLRRETDHRVTNSLSVVASLVSLQAEQVQHEESISAIQSIEARIQTIALLHRQLCKAVRIDRLNLSNFLTNVMRLLQEITPDNIDLDGSIDSIMLDSKAAASVAILLNEVITNSIKYAFPGNNTGGIFVRGEKLDSQHYRLTCVDTGVGFDEPKNQKSGLGMLVIDTLTTQLKGTYKVESTDKGAYFELIFPIQENERSEPSHKLPN